MTVRGGPFARARSVPGLARAVAVERAGLPLPAALPAAWVVDCKGVGDGSKALLYLGRYLYRGVVQEADILRCENGLVSFRYRDAKTGKSAVRTLPGAEFLWLVLQHVLPKRLRRARRSGSCITTASPRCG